MRERLSSMVMGTSSRVAIALARARSAKPVSFTTGSSSSASSKGARTRNLSALATAHDTARRRQGLGPYDRVRFAVSDQAHSSIGNAFRVIGVEPSEVPIVDHRLTGPALRAGLLVPSVRDRYTGIEYADSLVIDPHKWLFAPLDRAALLYREPHPARAVHTQDASYLDALHTDDTQ